MASIELQNLFPTYFVITGVGCGQLEVAKTYPETEFRDVMWSPEHRYHQHTLAVLNSTYNKGKKEVIIHAFYAKTADKNAGRFISKAERHALSGRGRALLCACLSTIPDDTKVELDASGGFIWSINRHEAQANKMSNEERMQYFSERDLSDEYKRAFYQTSMSRQWSLSYKQMNSPSITENDLVLL